MASGYLARFERLATSDRFDGIRRPAYVAGLAVAIAGLILGAAYGGPVRPVAYFTAVLMGGLFSRRTATVRGKELYGNVLLGTTAGAVLSSLLISGFISLSLGVPVMNAIWATALRILTSAAVVASLGLAGFVGALLITSLGLTARESVAVALFVGGALAFAAIQLRLGSLRPETDSLATPVLTGGAYDRYQLYRYAGFAAGAGAFAGFVSLLGSRGRRRVAVAGLLVAGLAIGTAGVGSVGADISHARTVTAISDRASAAVTAANVTDDDLELAVRVRNPSDRAIRPTGLYVRAWNGTEQRLGYGAGRAVAGTAGPIGPDGTATVRYRVPLSPAQADRLDATLGGDGFVVSGSLSLRLADRGTLPVSADSGVVLRFNCSVTAGGVSC